MKPDSTPIGEAKVRLVGLVGWGVVGQLSYVISQFILLIALARYTSVEEVGRFGLVSAIALPVYRFFNFGVRINQATDIKSEYFFCDFLALRFAASLMAYFLIAVIAIVFLGPEAQAIMMIFGAAKGVETYSELCYGAFQKSDRMRAVAISLVIRGFGGAIFFGITIALTSSIIFSYLGLLIVWSGVAFAKDLPLAVRISKRSGNLGRFHFGASSQLAIQSLPLAFNATLSALQGSVPRYVISYFLGLGALGQFTIVGYAMQAATTVSNAVGQSIVARLAHYVSIGNFEAFTRVMRVFIVSLSMVTAFGALVSWRVGDWLLVSLFGPEYGGQGNLLSLAIVAAGVVAAATILQSGLLSARLFGANLAIRVISFICILIFTVIGVALANLEGVLVGMIAAACIQCMALATVLRRVQTGEQE